MVFDYSCKIISKEIYKLLFQKIKICMLQIWKRLVLISNFSEKFLCLGFRLTFKVRSA